MISLQKNELRYFYFTMLAVALLAALGSTATAEQFGEIHTVKGDNADDLLGWSVSDVGDIDGSGSGGDEFIVGAPGHDNERGLARVYSGEEANIMPSILREYAGGAGDQFGYSVSGAGVFSGDQIDDFIVGAPWTDKNGDDSGNAHVFSGNELIDALGNDNTERLFNWDGDSADDRFGWSVSDVGDVDGDGWGDVIVGAPYDNNNGTCCGSARVLSGKDGGVIHTFYGDNEGDRFGWSVSGVGDFNGDEFNDFIVGAPGYDNNKGRAFIFSGNSPVDGDDPLSTMSMGSSGIEEDEFGYSVSGAGFVDDNLKADVIVGVPGRDNDKGLVFVFSVDGQIHLFFGDADGDQFGYSVSGAGDVNNDGHADLVVGAPCAINNGDNSGSATVYSGYSGDEMHVRNGDSPGDGFGWSVSGAGDVDGDGIDDFIVGAPYGGDLGAGYARVFGSTEEKMVIEMGDCNHDGKLNFLDITPFLSALSFGDYLAEADTNEDKVVDFLDMSPFIGLLSRSVEVRVPRGSINK